jgi:hypothetical protein
MLDGTCWVFGSGQLFTLLRRKESLMVDPILELLDKVRIRPNLYIGRHSVEALRMYLIGYQAALMDHTDLDLTRYDALIEGLYTKYGYGGGGNSWAWVLAQAAGGDAERLDLFFAELASFQHLSRHNGN